MLTESLDPQESANGAVVTELVADKSHASDGYQEPAAGDPAAEEPAAPTEEHDEGPAEDLAAVDDGMGAYIPLDEGVVMRAA